MGESTVEETEEEKEVTQQGVPFHKGLVVVVFSRSLTESQSSKKRL